MQNNCSLVLPIFEYYCLNWCYNPCQSTFKGLKESPHNLAHHNLCTFTPSGNWWVSIQSFILSKYASASSSGLAANSGLNVTNLIVVYVVFVVWGQVYLDLLAVVQVVAAVTGLLAELEVLVVLHLLCVFILYLSHCKNLRYPYSIFYIL